MGAIKEDIGLKWARIQGQEHVDMQLSEKRNKENDGGFAVSENKRTRRCRVANEQQERNKE